MIPNRLRPTTLRWPNATQRNGLVASRSALLDTMLNQREPAAPAHTNSNLDEVIANRLSPSTLRWPNASQRDALAGASSMLNQRESAIAAPILNLDEVVTKE